MWKTALPLSQCLSGDPTKTDTFGFCHCCQVVPAQVLVIMNLAADCKHTALVIFCKWMVQMHIHLIWMDGKAVVHWSQFPNCYSLLQFSIHNSTDRLMSACKYTHTRTHAHALIHTDGLGDSLSHTHTHTHTHRFSLSHTCTSHMQLSLGSRFPKCPSKESP